jgi:hypothetical protein
MLEKIEHNGVDASAQAYERWLKACREYDSSRQAKLYHSSFGAGMRTTLDLFPRNGERLRCGSLHDDVASAMLHEWINVGGDLWAGYLAATIDLHGAASSPKESEPAASTS